MIPEQAQTHHFDCLNAADAHEAIDRMARLQANWDSYGSPPPSAHTRKQAHHVIDRLAELGDLTFESVLPVSGGGIFIKLELYIEPEGGSS